MGSRRIFSSELRCFSGSIEASCDELHHICIVLDLSCSALMSNGKLLFFKLFSFKLYHLLQTLLSKKSKKLVTIVLVFSQTSAESGQTLCQCAELVEDEDIQAILNAYQKFVGRMNLFIPEIDLGVRSSQVVSTLMFRLGIVASLMCPLDCSRKVIIMGDSTCSLPFSVQEELLKIFYSFDISCSFISLEPYGRKSSYNNFGFVVDEGLLRLMSFNTNGCVFSLVNEVSGETNQMVHDGILDSDKGKSHSLFLFQDEFQSVPKTSIGGFVRQRFAVVDFEDTSLREYVIVKLREGYQFFQSSHDLLELSSGENSFLLSLAVRGDCLLHLLVATNAEPDRMWEASRFSVSIYLEGPYTFVHEFFVRNGTCSHSDCSISTQGMVSEYRMESYSKVMKILAALVNKTTDAKLRNDVKRFVKYISSENLPEPAVQGLQFFKQQFDSSGNKISVPNFYEGMDIYEHIGFWNFVYSLDLNSWQKMFNVNKFVYTMQPDPISEQLFLMSWTNAATKSRVVLKQVHEALRSCSTVVIQELFLYAQYVIDGEDNKKKLVLIRVNPDIQTVFTHCFVVYVAFPLFLSEESCQEFLAKFEECMSNIAVPGIGGESNPVFALRTFSKSVEKLCMRYDNCPEDFEILFPDKIEENDVNVCQDKLSLNVFSTLGSFYYHKRWIWCLPNVAVAYQNDSQLSASSVPSDSLNMYELLMNRVLETRLREGFSILYGNQGVVSLVKELPVSLKRINVDSKVLVQYVCFKPRVCRKSKRVLLAVEAWIEHHEGAIDCSSLFGQEVFCSYNVLIEKLERKDSKLFNEVLTFLMCYELTANDDVDINDLKLPKPKLKKSFSENLDERVEGRIVSIDYNFDALNLLEASQLYTFSWQLFEEIDQTKSNGKLDTDLDTYNSNELLIQSLHANLEQNIGRVAFYLSRSGSNKLLNYLQKVRNDVFSWAARFASSEDADHISADLFLETLVPNAPTKTLDDEPEQLEWAVYITDDNRDKSLFIVMVPQSMGDLKRINANTMETDILSKFLQIPVLIFHCKFNNIRQFDTSEDPQVFMVDSESIHRTFRTITKTTVDEMLLRVQVRSKL